MMKMIHYPKMTTQAVLNSAVAKTYNVIELCQGSIPEFENIESDRCSPYIQDAANSILSYGNGCAKDKFLIMSNNIQIGKKVALFLMNKAKDIKRKPLDMKTEESEHEADERCSITDEESVTEKDYAEEKGGDEKDKKEYAKEEWSDERDYAEAEWSDEEDDDGYVEEDDGCEEDGYIDDDEGYEEDDDGYEEDDEGYIEEDDGYEEDDDEIAAYVDDGFDDWDEDDEEVIKISTYDYHLSDASDGNISAPGMERSMDVSTISAIAQSSPGGFNMIFTGVDGGSFDEKLELVAAVQCKQKAIVVPMLNAGEAWAVEMMFKYGYIPVYINDVPDKYFADVLELNLKKNGLELEKMDTMRAVSFIRNKACSNASEFTEEIIEKAVEFAKSNAKDGATKIRAKDMIPGFGKEEESALETLNGMVGVDQIREVYQQCLALAKCSVENPELKKIRKSMIFTGNPGTGKSTCAGIISRALIEAGLCTSSMVTATRSDIIGQYVGHTSPKVRKLFRQARNGILFVDEADFFLNKDSGGYVLESLKEFVRYLEMYPDVTVIFAMYEKSVQAFYDLDAGLRSRIAGKCYFADYDDQQMCQILKNMLKKYKLSLAKGYKEILIPYIQKIRNSDNFGNARDMRNVAEMAIKIHCMNHSEGKTKDKNVISLDELKTAIDRLTPISAQKERRVAGFNSCWSNVTVS